MIPLPQDRPKNRLEVLAAPRPHLETKFAARRIAAVRFETEFALLRSPEGFRLSVSTQLGETLSSLLSSGHVGGFDGEEDASLGGPERGAA